MLDNRLPHRYPSCCREEKAAMWRRGANPLALFLTTPSLPADSFISFFLSFFFKNKLKRKENPTLAAKPCDGVHTQSSCIRANM
jgi:hypothetical protein